MGDKRSARLYIDREVLKAAERIELNTSRVPENIYQNLKK